jgi:excisionase family DNA binding protein
MSDRLISINEAAKLLGLSRITVYRMAESGRLPSVKLGSRRLIAESVINGLIAAATASEVR